MTGSSRYQPGSAGGPVRAGVEAPVRPVLGGRRGIRQRLGLVTVAVVAITVVAAGIGLGGRGPLPDPSASASVSSAAPSSSDGRPAPSRRPGTTPGPTPMNASGCIPVDPADLPRFRLASTGPSGRAANGVDGPSDWALATPQTSAWPVPLPSSALVVESTAALAIEPDDDACIRYAVAEYLAVKDIGGIPTPLGLGEINVFPPAPGVVLGGVPLGDWLVRVVTYYSTGVAGNEDKAVVERFFRVTTDLNPDVSPEITPAVPCVTPEPGAPVGLSLQLGDGEPVPGVDLDTYRGNIANNGALVEGSGTDPLVLLVDGNACATSWSVQWLDSGGGTMFEVVQANRSENPYLVSQNRIPLLPEQDIFGHIALSATVQLGLGRSVRAAWELQRSGPPLPPIEVQGPDGQTVAGVPGCGSGWNYADGRSSWEMCETTPIPDAVRLLSIRSGDIVTILTPGLTVQNWSVNCGTREGRGGGEFGYIGCDLGGGMSGPMRFLPYPGRSVMQIYLSLQSGVDQMYGSYFVEIFAEP